MANSIIQDNSYDDMPKISVIIPALNEEKYIRYSMEGLRHQTFKDFETIVVDSNSTDNTRKIARKYAKVVLADRMGAGAARNVGAKAAKGEILVFLDADTKPSKNLLMIYSNTLKKGFVAATGPIYPLEKAKREVKLAYRVASVDLIKLSIKIGMPSLIGSNIAVRKDVFDSVHGFNNDYITCEDWDLARRVMKKGKIKFIDDAFVHTSIRRAAAWGIREYALFTFENMIRYYLFKKPNKSYEKIG